MQFLAATVESIRDRMATKEDLLALSDRMDRELDAICSEMATKEDLALLREEVATKSELGALRETMAAGFTAVRGDIERVNLRLDSVDRSLTTRLDGMDNQISRLRSVVYLLGKDQPDVLRLLGGTPL